jgi:cupin fold WbuC family metalloprotein
MGNTLFFLGEVFVLDEQKIIELKSIALKHPLKRARFCLHESQESSVQEMVIVAHRESNIEAHKHPINKPESYHIIDGQLSVNIFSPDGEVIKNIILSDHSHPKMYRINGDIWHQPVPVSEWVVYHEVFTGPFDKNFDVKYNAWGRR